MNSCDRLKHYLLKHGAQSVQDDEHLGSHLQDCQACSRLLQSWERIPGLLDELPEYEPDEALSRRTHKSIVEPVTEHVEKPRQLPRLATSLASAAVLLAVIGVSRQIFDEESPSVFSPAFKEEYELAEDISLEQQREVLLRSSEISDGPRGAQALDNLLLNESKERDAAQSIGGGFAMSAPQAQPDPQNYRIDKIRPEEEKSASVTADRPVVRHRRMSRPRKPTSEEITVSGSRIGGADLKNKEEGRLRGNKKDADGSEFADLNATVRASGDDESEEITVSGHALDEADNERAYRNELSKRQQAGQSKLPDSPVAVVGKLNLNLADRRILKDGYLGAQTGLESDFFGYYQDTESLQFQPAEGYWANTHVPGDPAIRLLKSRLTAWDRSGMAERLEQDVVPVSQPFDAPADNALALSVMSDANAVEGATRMRLQVGIRGIEHRRGQRPAMNMGVVVDLPENADDATRIATRALLDAVLASKQPGDHFSLVINGPQGLVVPPEDFRFGPLQLARQAILGDAPATSGKSLELAAAISQATDLVRQTVDPSQPLGSSSILLLSANTLNDIEGLTQQIHNAAKEGTTLSVVPLGNLPRSEQVEQLVLAGLGNRRILEAPDQARQLVEAELHSSSRAVARAARLSIRLAPGVRLIDVVGSERLDAKRSQRVRDIENSMDRRLSQNLGIQADRGEDEDGIQIVIPSIFSGDDVTILVDVLVDKPGDVASVSLRYKDLVYSRNGNLRGQLSLPAGQLDRGPAEFTVLKNLLAHHFSEAARQAADAIGQQQFSEAAAILIGMRDEIDTLQNQIPAFKNDPGLQRDQQILDRYIEILTSPEAYQPELADSLRYAAWAKAHRPLSEWK